MHVNVCMYGQHNVMLLLLLVVTAAVVLVTLDRIQYNTSLIGWPAGVFVERAHNDNVDTLEDDGCTPSELRRWRFTHIMCTGVMCR